ncbi:YchJ family protein [Actinomyces sp.]|uniref:YchJ family protein n=1 Tax=Actinomyces sp. TaxID=29317 RepID=UPI0034C6652D
MPATTAEALMRSRFTAYVLGDEDHLFRSWHPRTRPPGPYCHPGTRWTRLEIHEVVEAGAPTGAGLPGPGEAIVDFTAHCTTSDMRGRPVGDALHERSLFRRRGGRWVYVEAVGDDSRGRRG